MTCAFCGAPLPLGARYCPSCGAPVATSPGTEERKMVTVLFADLVDSSGLAQRLDAERAREVLARFYDAATEELLAHRGHPEKFIGDAAMAVFGLAQVREDDAVRAVRAGLAIRERTRRLGEALGLAEALDVHVGIEAGEAATGRGPAGQLLVTGAVVNEAARLQAAASPGEVLVGRTAHQLTSGSAAFGPVRAVSAKGFADGLEAYPVEGLSVRSVRRTIPLVGRAGELAILRGSLAHTIEGAHPHLVSLIGEPGVGKSRLADEFLSSAEVDVRRVVSRGRPSFATATFAPAASLVGQIAGIEDTDAPEVTTGKLRAAAERWCPPGVADSAAERLGLLFGIGDPHREESLYVADIQGSVIAFLDGVSAHAPLVLVLEDAHELRPAMLDLMERLVGRRVTEPRRLLVLALARPELLEARPEWASDVASHTLVRLDPLSAADAEELVRRASAVELDDARARELARRTGGNPFFIIESTGALLRRIGGGAGAELPATVRAVIAARLDALPTELRELARRASAFLYSFDEHEVAAIAEADPERLRALEDAEILVRDDDIGVWRFRHEMVREVAYASLPKRERRRLHETIAGWLTDPDEIAWAADHLERAAAAALDLDPADREPADRAIDALTAAADRARRRSETRSALDLGRRALALAGPEDAWGRREAWILAGVGEALYWVGEFATAVETLDRAVTLGEGEDRVIAHALRFRGDLAINFEDDLDAAEEMFVRSLEAAKRSGDGHAIARTLLFAGWVPWHRERFEEAAGVWSEALAAAEAAGDRWAKVRILTAMSVNAAENEDVAEGTRLIEKAQALAEEMDDRLNVAVTSIQRGRRAEEAGAYEDAVPLLDRGIEIFRELGARWDLADALAERGIVHRERGRLDEAERDLEEAVGLAEELGDRQLPSWMYRALSRVAELRGDAERAAHLMDHSREAGG